MSANEFMEDFKKDPDYLEAKRTRDYLLEEIKKSADRHLGATFIIYADNNTYGMFNISNTENIKSLANLLQEAEQKVIDITVKLLDKHFKKREEESGK